MIDFDAITYTETPADLTFMDWNALCVRARVAEPTALFNTLNAVHRFLVEVNKVTNLTRILDLEGFWIKHVADSLLIGEAAPESFLEAGKKWCDFGCGGGFPSIVLAAAYPQLHITAIDSIGKKTAFVEACALKYNLKNLHVVTGRGCELQRKREFQSVFDVLTARAVATPSRILEEAGRMIHPRGAMMLYQTPEQVRAEMENGLERTHRNWRFIVTPPCTLMQNAGERCFLIAQHR